MLSLRIHKLVLFLSVILVAGGCMSCNPDLSGKTESEEFEQIFKRINMHLDLSDTVSAIKDLDLMESCANSDKDKVSKNIYSAIINGSDVRLLGNLVDEYESANDWQRIRLYDPNAVVRLFIAYSVELKRVKRGEEAETAINEALRCAYDNGLMDQYALLQCALLRHFEDAGDFDSALGEYNKLLTLCRYHDCKEAQLEVLLRICMCFLSFGDTPTAKVYLDEMQSLSDDSPLSQARYWYGMARISDANSDTLLFEHSLEQLNALHRFNEDVRSAFSVAMYAMQALHFLKVGQDDAAFFAVNKAIIDVDTPSSYNPPKVFLEVLRADIFLRKQDLFNAKVTLDSIDPVALRNENVEVYRYYASVCSRYYASIGDAYLAYTYAQRNTNLADTLEFDVGTQNLAYKSLEQRRDTTVVAQRNMLNDVIVERRKLVFFQSLWIAGFVIALVASFIGYYSISNRRLIYHNNELELMRTRLTDEVNERKGKLEVQKAKLDAKNESMRAELSFAKLIQSNILTSDDILSSPGVNGHFVFFVPCNQVSGDFYWFFDSGDKLFICAADATGHGIPGAMISMVGSTLLSDIVANQSKRIPSRILESLSVMLIEVLRNNNDIINDDSIDMSLLCIDREAHSCTLSMARHVAYVVRKSGDVEVVQGTKRCVGEIIETDNGRPFEDINLDLHEDDCIYLASDGFVSQFGGPTNEKYKRRRFENLLVSVHDKGMTQQRQIIEHNFIEWKGENEQTDDVLVVGVRIGKL